MTKIAWTRRAIDDVLAIRSFIAQDSPQSATLVARRIIDAVERLAQFPDSGRVVPELNDAHVREVIHGPYRIVYRRVESTVHVVTVHHAARLFPPL
jgi:plasmid stabilization system protein ParE